jgi:hypothetical protein
VVDVNAKAVQTLATAHAESGVVAGLKILLISGLIAAIGAIVLFDPFGLVSKYRFPSSSGSLELQEKYGRPDVAKLVGGMFLCVGGVTFIVILIGEIILLVR